MIKGLEPTLAEGGKIKCGGLGAERKGSSGTYRLPQKLDHLIVTKTTRNQAGDLIIDEELMALLPQDPDGKCREIPIVLHDDDIERVFPTTYALYSGKKLTCRGDGELATRYEMKEGQRTGNVKEMACPCPYLNAERGFICKPHGTLHCSLRVPGRALAGAVYKWRTTSLISIRRMIGSLQQIRDVCGTLCGVPLVLKLEAVAVTPANAPASTVYCCHVELRAQDLLEVQRQAIESGRMRQRVRQSLGYQALLTAPGVDESDEEEEEIAAEFHPIPEQVEAARMADASDQRPPIQPPRRASESTDVSDSTPISAAMVKRLYSIASHAGHQHDGVKSYLDGNYGITSANDVPRNLYGEICDRLSNVAPLESSDTGDTGQQQDPTDIPPPEAPQGTATLELLSVVRVTEKSGKTDGISWTRYGVLLRDAAGGEKWSDTFDKDIADYARSAAESEQRVEVELTPGKVINGKPTLDLVTIRVADDELSDDFGQKPGDGERDPEAPWGE